MLRWREGVVLLHEGPIRGTGFLISRDLVLTARHISGHEELIARFPDGAEYETAVVWQSKDYDVAILRLNEQVDAAPLRVSCQVPRYGEPIIVIGHPGDIEWDVVLGNVSVVKPDKDGDMMLSLSLFFGSSGSPVIGNGGRVIGVLSSIRRQFDPRMLLLQRTMMVPLAALCKDPRFVVWLVWGV